MAKENEKPDISHLDPEIYYFIKIGRRFSMNNPEAEGIEEGQIHLIVDCPEEEKEKYENDIWIMGKTSPIRLFSDECHSVENSDLTQEQVSQII